jgi:hypothetical protein
MQLFCKIFGHASTVFEDGDWRCPRCGVGFYGGLAKAMREDVKEIQRQSANTARNGDIGSVTNGESQAS